MLTAHAWESQAQGSRSGSGGRSAGRGNRADSAALRRKGSESLQAGRFPEAAALLRQYVAGSPRDDSARALLARALLRAGKPASALQEYAALLRRRPGNPDYLLGRAEALAAAGRQAEALVPLRQVRAKNPGREDALRLEVRLLGELGREAERRSLLALAKRRFPRTDWQALLLSEPESRLGGSREESAQGPAGLPDLKTPAGLGSTSKGLQAPRAGGPEPKELAQARTAGAERRYDEAEQFVRQWLAGHPEDQDARFLLARILTWQGKTTAALAEYDRLLTFSPKNVDYWVGRAQAQFAANRLADALKSLEQARGVNPWHEETHRLQVQVLRRMGNEEQLAVALRQAARLFPGADWLTAPAQQDNRAMDRARIAVSESRFTEAETMLREWLVRTPSDENARFLLARVLAWQGKTGEAAVEYDRLLERAPRSLDYLVGKAQVLVAASRAGEALPLLQQAKELSPRYEEIYRLEIQALRRMGDTGRLNTAVTEATRRFPGRDWLAAPAAARDSRALEQARIAIGAGQYDQAERLLREWLQQNPGDTEAQARLARVLTWQGKTEAALAEYERLVRGAPNNVDLLIGQGQAFLQAERFREAAAVLERARSLSPRHEDIYRLLAQALIGAGERERLATLAADARRLFPNSGWPDVIVRPLPQVTVVPAQPSPEDEARWQELRETVNAGRLAEAERLTRSWLERYPLDDNARLLLARILLWQGKLEEAGREGDAVLGRDPNNPDALLGKAELFLRRDRPFDALPLLSKARKLAPDYQEVYRLEIQTLRLAGLQKNADELREEARRRFPDAVWLQPRSRIPDPPGVRPAVAVARARQETPGPPGTRRRVLEIGAHFVYEFLNRRYGDWREFAVSAGPAGEDSPGLQAAVRQTQRFGHDDTEVAAGYTVPLGKRAALNFQVTGSPTNRVLPVYSAGAGLSWQLGDAWALQPGFQRTEYRAAASNRAILGLEHRLGSFRAAYALHLASNEGVRDTTSHHAGLTYVYGRDGSLTLGLTLGEDIQSFGPRRVAGSNVFGLSLSGRHWLQPRWALDWGFGWFRQGELFQRTGVSLGLRYVP